MKIPELLAPVVPDDEISVPANLEQSKQEWYRLNSKAGPGPYGRAAERQDSFDLDEIIISSDIGDIAFGTETVVKTPEGFYYKGRRAKRFLRGKILKMSEVDPPKPSIIVVAPAQQPPNPLAAARAFANWQLIQYQRKKREPARKDFWDSFEDLYAAKLMIKSRKR